jgi:hypothetical protein
MVQLKKIHPLIIMLFCQSIITFGQVSTEIENNAPQKLPFQSGEWFEYRIHYGIFNASYASLELVNDTIKGLPVLHAKGYGRTTGLARLFFKLEDYYDTYFDEKKVIPYWFIRDIYEGGYTKNLEINFDHEKNTALVNNKKNNTKAIFKIAENTQDILSAFYYLRAFYPEEKMEIDQTFSVNMFFDSENYIFKMKYVGKESLSTKFGKIRCMKFRPYVQSGRVFREKESVTLWITDDENKVPIRLQAELVIGAINADLDNFKNLKYPFRIMIN